MVFFAKTYPALGSLASESTKENGSYKEPDVINQLQKDFKNKCYICETKDIEAINIEHFAPHKNINLIRKFQWANLFWACNHCNHIKSDREPLLNCTVKSDGVDRKIRYFLDDNLINNKVVIEALDGSIETQNSVQLLIDIDNGTNHKSLHKIQAKSQRNRLYDEMSDFTSLVLKYFGSEDEEKQGDYQREIIKQLSNKSAFTAFKRWFIKDNPKYKTQFEHYIIDKQGNTV